MPNCLRCGHDWDQRVAGRPRQCPNCKSPRWDTPRLGAESPQVKPPAKKRAEPQLKVTERRVGPAKRATAYIPPRHRREK